MNVAFVCASVDVDLVYLIASSIDGICKSERKVDVRPSKRGQRDQQVSRELENHGRIMVSQLMRKGKVSFYEMTLKRERRFTYQQIAF